MKFGYTADIHLSRYGQDKVEDESNLPERLHSIKASLDAMAQHLVDNDIKDMIFGGDLLHGKSIIYAIAQDLMIDYFDRWSDLLQFYVIDGNHDLSGKGHKVVSALKPLRSLPGVTWVPFDETLKLGDMLMVPYGPNMVDIIKKNSARILISHFGLNEGILNSGISIVSDLAMKDLDGRYELVLLGHYHKPQEIIRPSISLYYVGSPIQLDWGEKNDDKRFLIVDSDNLEVESVSTIGYKKHIEFDIEHSNKEAVLQAAKEAREKGHWVKILKREAIDLGVDNDFMIIDKVEKDITNRGITSGMSHSDKFKKFLEIKEITEADHEVYLRKALDLVDRCEG